MDSYTTLASLQLHRCNLHTFDDTKGLSSITLTRVTLLAAASTMLQTKYKFYRKKKNKSSSTNLESATLRTADPSF